MSTTTISTPIRAASVATGTFDAWLASRAPQHTGFAVYCQDGVRRHSLFATRRDADEWAQWGHCCTTKHTTFVVTL
jgi:hypothetical protein